MNLARFKTRFIWLWLGAACVFSCPVMSVDLPIIQAPLATSALASPIVMFALSRDHQLHSKAYTDTTDLNSDGKIDFTYDDTVNYLGYFDSNKCYLYADADGRFEPQDWVDNIRLPPETPEHECSGGDDDWSGNFLNWATMTRMDIVRRILYGGYRSTDEPSTYPASPYPNYTYIPLYENQEKTTVLERDMIPFDAHAFVKVFSSGDMNKYTPYSVSSISICNLTQGEGLSKDISTLEYPPLMRVVSGPWPEWASDAGIQCQWADGESTTKPGKDRNLIDPGTEKAQIVRVEVCVSELGEDNCKPYFDPDNPEVSLQTTYKPTGLQQKYQDNNSSVVMGLYSGSWTKNKKGGVFRALSRKNAFDPIYLDSIDVFHQHSDNYFPLNGTLLSMDILNPYGSIPLSLDRFRITGYNFGVINDSGDPDGYGYNNTLDWGNPINEIYSQVLLFLSLNFKYTIPENPIEGRKYTDTLAYLVDDSENVPTRIPPNPFYYSFDGFNYGGSGSIDSSTKDPYGPPDAIPDPDPDPRNFYLNYHRYADETSWCSVKTAVIMSSGTNSFDTDDIAKDLVEPDTLGAPPTDLDIDEQTDWVGTQEGFSGKYLLGSNGDIIDGQCTPKSLSSLSSAKGTCPDGPNLKGGYQMAGMAHYVRSNDLHKHEYDFINPAFSYAEHYWVGDQTISTYSILLSEAARFAVTVEDDEDDKVTLMPACLANPDANAGEEASGWEPCSITDVRVENLEYAQDTKDLISGTFTVTWEDTTEGGDYDMDGYERVAFCVGPTACNDYSVTQNRLRVTTSVLKTDTNKAMRFGYALSGSGATDGSHYPLLCVGGSNCIATEATPSTYAKGTDATSAKLLESPLWYAAKYGGFQTLDANKDLTPQDQGQASWDANADGVPDKFYNATNPLLLAEALDKSLTTLASSITSSASAAANSTRLDTSAALYQAKYLPSTWAGQLLAYAIDTSTGHLSNTPVWDAGAKLADRDYQDRLIYSYNEITKQGIEFNYDLLSDANKLLLSATELNYIKGDTSNEISINNPSGVLRERLGPYKLGDIVNSDPQFVSNLSKGYDRLPGDDGKEGSDYLKYISSPAYKARPPMLAVGANDGMLHVFNASLDETGGQELFAYVPTTIISNLKLLTSPLYSLFYNHRYYVDGSPLVSDAYIDTDGNGDKEWRTVLVGGLGAGGKGVFALDITLLNPTDYKTTETFSKDRVLWEINDNLAFDNDDRAEFSANLGFTMGQASIARMANGQFAAVFGNGYNSHNQQAVLYIVDLATGQLIKAINTGVGSTTNATTVNGLSAPLTVDANGDHIVDAIYAGDYKGNLWKFDVSSDEEDDWDVAETSDGDKVPLFTAVAEPYNFSVGIAPYNEIDNVTIGGPLSIVAKPVFMQHPRGGVMLYFGTGRYFMLSDLVTYLGWWETADESAYYKQINGFYGIWDNCMSYAGSEPTCFITPIASKSDLVKQTIVAENGAQLQRQTSKNTVDYLNTTKRGWYFDLVYCKADPDDLNSINCGQLYSQERVVSEAIIVNQKIIFSTLYLNPSICEAGGGSWLMSLDALTGKSPETSSFLTTVGGVENTPIPNITVDGQQYAVTGVRSTVGITDTASVVKTDDGKIKLWKSGSKGKTEVHTMLGSHGNRHSWVQIR
ncbi:MAG: hypothetical protein HOP34_01165 [Methylococcaceae bacterium]|nr:hypothetical protein [Methylococcaceae bacterium]